MFLLQISLFYSFHIWQKELPHPFPRDKLSHEQRTKTRSSQHRPHIHSTQRGPQYIMRTTASHPTNERSSICRWQDPRVLSHLSGELWGKGRRQSSRARAAWAQLRSAVQHQGQRQRRGQRSRGQDDNGFFCADPIPALLTTRWAHLKRGGL